MGRRRKSGGGMGRGQGRSSRRGWALGLLLGALAGCTASRSHLEQALLADRTDAAQESGRAERYVVRCPDVLEFGVEGRDDLSGPRRVGADGRVALDDAV